MRREIAAKLGEILSSGRDPHSKLDDIKRLADELDDPREDRFTFVHMPEPAKLEGDDVPRHSPPLIDPPLVAAAKKRKARVKPAATKYRRS